jgi:two-component system, NarL family, sensor histidine kinase DesK
MRLLPKDSPVGWLPYTWLIYLSFYVASAMFTGGSVVWWTAHVLALAAFLPLYFRGFWIEGPRILPIIAGICAIGILMIPWNPGASAFFIFAAGFAGDVGRPADGFKVIVAILAVLGIEACVLQLPATAWVPGLTLTAMVGGGNVFFSERRRGNERLRLAHEEIAHLAKVAERERIARDLHDLLGHTLSLIVLKSELAAKLAERDLPRAAAEIRDVERISRDALNEVRRAVQGFRQVTLEESLAGARQALLAAGIELDCAIDAAALPPAVEAAVSLVLREAVTNVVRHARARRCVVRLATDRHRVRLEVADDGIGGSGPPGTGLVSMRQRVEALGGRFEYERTAGTRIIVEVPGLAAAEAAS